MDWDTAKCDFGLYPLSLKLVDKLVFLFLENGRLAGKITFLESGSASHSYCQRKDPVAVFCINQTSEVIGLGLWPQPLLTLGFRYTTG